MSGHVIRRTLPYQRELLFDLVLNVERYPQFVPGWEAARVYDRREQSYRTDQIVRMKMIRQRFDSVTTFERPHWITVRASGGVIKRFDLSWHFQEVQEGETLIELKADLTLKAPSMDKLLDSFAKDSNIKLVEAFEREAAKRVARSGRSA